MNTKYISQGLLLMAFFAGILCACTNSDIAATEDKKEEKPVARIISLNGSITELLFEMGQGDKLVGVDVTSTFPEACKSLPHLGHVRQLNPEGILALKPTIVFVDKKSGGTPALKNIADAGIKVVEIEIGQTLDAPLSAADALLTALELEDKSLKKKLEDKLTADKENLKTILAKQSKQPKVLFIYARGAKTLMVSGKNTPVAAMIEIAGGQNAFSEFEDFKPLTPEALLQAKPDVLLLFDTGLESLSDKEKGLDPMAGLLAIPGIKETPAAKNKNIITMDGQYLSGFGPRVGQAACALAEKLLPLSK